MLPWPKKIPQPNLPTIPETDLIPSTYFQSFKMGFSLKIGGCRHRSRQVMV